MKHTHPPAPGTGFKMEPLYYLLAAVPLAVVLKLAGAGDLLVFVAAGAAILPLAGLMGRATENLAETMGAGIGGLINATFGNAAELIIAVLALARGPDFYPLVKASITGSIIGNILLVLGLSIVAGGVYYKKQVFNRTAAAMGATLMALACIGLLMPTLYREVLHAGAGGPGVPDGTTLLSEEIAAVLLAVYALSLVFSLKTHQHLFAGPEGHTPAAGPAHEPEWSRRTSFLVLLASTAGVAVMAEFLVATAEHAGEALGMNKVFIGVFVVAIIGNAAEHSTAILVAMKDKMDLAVTIAVGSSIQIALFVAPVLVFLSMAMSPARPLDLHFTPMEIVAVTVAVAVVALIAQDGETHWFEGVMLLAVYAILGLAFFHLPLAGQ